MEYFSKNDYNRLCALRAELRKELSDTEDVEKIAQLERRATAVENKMVKMLKSIADNYAKRQDYRKYPDFVVSEFVQVATIKMWRRMDLYNFLLKKSPLAYFTQAVFNSFCNSLRAYYRTKNREFCIEAIENYGEVS